ncbi:hypothetical protein [Phenylobacterium terrae]|uniref:hypothetical protein n=2 Tax=Phenylobacterium terrae TaxID=2665495 RepID=UPI00366E1B70
MGVSTSGYHVLQYAFVDSRGEVVMSAYTHAPSPVALIGSAPAKVGAEPLSPEAFERMATQICAGARLIGFHKRLQGGLLPERARRAAAGLQCAAQTFEKRVGRGEVGGRGEAPSLAACLEHAGLPQPASDDAEAQALAVRDLWRWATAA